MSRLDYADRPNRIPWPPLLLIGAIVVGSALSAFLPLTFLPEGGIHRIALWLGTALVVAAIALDIWAFLIFRRHQTTILPHQPTKHLVTTGPFALSRNPIYLGNLTILFGIGLRAASLWFFILMVPMAFLVLRLAILREEAHLAANHPEEWRAYSVRVGRWFGRSDPKP